VRIGSTCPTGDFPEDLPAGASVVHVLAGADPSVADGSASQPFATLAAATAVATDWSIVALGRGSYDEPVALPAGVTLWGACVRDAVLTTSAASGDEGTIDAGAGATVRNLTIADSARYGIQAVGTGDPVVVEDVIVRGAEGAGLRAWYGTGIEARSVFIDGTRFFSPGQPEEGMDGYGLDVCIGSSASLDRVVLSDNHAIGVRVCAGSSLIAEDFAIIDTQLDMTPATPAGLFAVVGATVEARRAVVERNRGVGVASIAGSSVLLEDVVVRNTREISADGPLGVGLYGEDGGGFDASRIWVEDNRLAGIDLVGNAGTLVIHDGVVRNTRSQALDGSGGGGVSAHSSSGAPGESPPTSVELDRLYIDANRSWGLELEGRLVTARVTDVTIRGVDPAANGSQGHGVAVQDGADVGLERVRVERSTGVGIRVSEGELDSSVRPEGAHAPSLRLLDVAVVDTQSLPPESTAGSGQLGRGLQIQLGTVTGQRLLLERNREVGLMAFRSRVVLEDVTILDTQPAECGDECPVHAFGHGLVKGPIADVRVDRFTIDGSSLCGVLLEGEGLLTLHDGTISNAEIGACVQVDGYDIGRLMDDVVYVDNELSLDGTSSLPLPDPAVAF
jgi:hypothetical protein